MDIYQRILDADIQGNGILPVYPTDEKDISKGYIEVNIKNENPNTRIFKEIYIPERKKRSYQLVENLFDNYSLNQTESERETQEESREVNDYLTFAIQSPPIQIAKKFTEEKLKQKFNTEQWLTYLYDLWFRPFNSESGKNLSGFEHVFIGEQKRRDLVGHHFWYKYWLEDNPELNKHHQDQIKLIYSQPIQQKQTTPYIMTVGFHLKAYDYTKRRFISISKKRCALFVGLSAEGILALGTVRALPKKDVPKQLIINNAVYELALFMSPDNKSIRTFYPKLVL